MEFDSFIVGTDGLLPEAFYGSKYRPYTKIDFCPLREVAVGAIEAASPRKEERKGTSFVF